MAQEGFRYLILKLTNEAFLLVIFDQSLAKWRVQVLVMEKLWRIAEIDSVSGVVVMSHRKVELELKLELP